MLKAASLLVLLSIMFIERHNRGNSFNIVFHTIALIRRVDGILIKTKTHQYSIDFQFVIKQSHNWNTAPIPCRNRSFSPYLLEGITGCLESWRIGRGKRWSTTMMWGDFYFYTFGGNRFKMFLE